MASSNDRFFENSFEDNSDQIFENAIKNNQLEYQNKLFFLDLYSKKLKESNEAELKDRLKNEKLTAEKREELENELAALYERLQKESADAATAYRENLYAKSSRKVKAEILKSNNELLQQQRKNIEDEFQRKLAVIQATSGEQEDKEREIAELRKEYEEKSAINHEELRKNYERTIELSKSGINDLKANIKGLKDDKKAAVSGIVNQLTKLDLKELRAQSASIVEASSERLDQLQQEIEEARANGEDTTALMREAQSVLNNQFMNGLKANLLNALEKTFAAYNQSFQQAEKMLTEYQSHIDARLQGTDKSYKGMMGLISTNLSVSPYVKTQQVIENMRQAVDKGIAYNVEQRAFLNTISDKIANTFDAFDASLIRLIKLQQADSTAARLGMEASLTKLFNGMFNDTSYLTNLSDSVAAAIIDANSQLDRNQSAEFEYVVQKWLGSLSALGMSDSTINNIAQGINYLATGDVTSLSSNTSLQTLFAMSSAKANLEYSDLLLTGLDANNTNKLLQAMVEYLKEIAENSDSQVVKAAYGDIFNMSLSDMKAISNLSSSDISNIASNMLTYSDMNNELSWQMNSLLTRVNMAEKLSNLYNNAIFGVAEDMVNNPFFYAMTKMLDFMDDTNVDIAIPFVNAAGFGLDLNTSVQDLMRLSLGVAQATSLMTNIIGGLSSRGELNLDSWGATETNKRGKSLTFTTASMLGDTSGSTYISSSSMSDMKQSTLHTATDEAENTKEITNKNTKAEYTIEDFYKDVVGSSAEKFVKTHDTFFELVYNNDDNYLSVKDNHLVVDDGKLRVYDEDLNNTVRYRAIRVKPEYDTLAVHIASMDDSIKSARSTVSLAKGTTVNIDKDTLVKAFREAMGHDDREEVKNIGDLMKAIEDGTLVIKIANETGKRLQVDTELNGTSGYVSQINW